MFASTGAHESSCLRFLALRERCRAKLAGDVIAEVRAWKLFCFVPMMILCKPRSTGSVGRDQLAKGIEDFEGGRWVELLESVVAFIPGVRHRTQCTKEEDMIRRWAGRPKPCRKRAGFSCPPRICWCPIGFQERGNPCPVATSASTGTAQRVATHSHGFPARTSIEFGQEDPRLSSWFTFWCGCRPRRVHQRDAPCLPR